jgi:phage terminase large subunit-like protein
MGRSAKTELAMLPEWRAAEWLSQQPDWVLHEILQEEWWWTGRPEQFAPPGDWFVWLMLSGRGFGKTRSSAEWLADRVIRFPLDVSGYRTEWMIIAETLSDAMRLCVNGPSGIARVLERRLGEPRRSIHDGTGQWRIFKAQKPLIQLYDKGGKEAQVIYTEGADNEDVARGFNLAGAWLDEFAKWPKPDGSWIEGIAPALRAELPDGEFPRVVVATTPKLVVQLVEWKKRKDGSVVVTSGSTYDNASNLAAPTLAELHKRYEGTRLGRQELHGELIEEIEGAMWALDWIERDRVRPEQIPTLVYTTIGMDPAGSGTRDETGLVCAARGNNGQDYILGDWSKPVAGHAAARRAWEMFHAYRANVLVVEKNMGGRWLSDVLYQAYREMQAEGIFPSGGTAPVKLVTAKVGKKLRAEPVAGRYEQGGRVHHVKGQNLQDLETQQISWVPGETKDSPDRVDALVYAELALYDREGGEVRTASPLGRALPGQSSMGPLAGAWPGR